MKCLQCQSDYTEKDLKTKIWSIVKLTALEHRGFFVGSGDVHVRGWQLESINEDFSTDLCITCLESYQSEANEAYLSKCAFFKKWQKILYITCLPVGLVTLAIIIGVSFFKPDMPMNFYLAGLTAVGIIPIIFSCFDPSAHKPASDSLEAKMHRNHIEPCRKAICERLNTEIRPLILHPEPLMPAPPNMLLGMQFIVPKSALSTYENTKKKTGWSRIDYYHRDGTGIEGNYSPQLQRENLQNIQLEHWGEFLSKPASSLEHITGFFVKPVVEGQII